MSPTTYQESVATLMAVACEYCVLSFGDAAVKPVETTVVVPGVTAAIVTTPVFMLMKLSCVPTAKATLAFVGILIVVADAELIDTRVVASPMTTV